MPGGESAVPALSCAMTNAILKYLIAFIVTAVTVKVLSRPAIRIGLVDRPGGRKRHDAPVPLIGGPAMFAGFVFGALTLLESLYLYRVLFVSMALLVVVGVLDDARDLKPSSKSVAQLVAALFMTSWAGLFVTQLGQPVRFRRAGSALTGRFLSPWYACWASSMPSTWPTGWMDWPAAWSWWPWASCAPARSMSATSAAAKLAGADDRRGCRLPVVQHPPAVAGAGARVHGRLRQHDAGLLSGLVLRRA